MSPNLKHLPITEEFVIGNRSDAALPELSTTFRIQPTNDSIMYLTP